MRHLELYYPEIMQHDISTQHNLCSWLHILLVFVINSSQSLSGQKASLLLCWTQFCIWLRWRIIPFPIPFGKSEQKYIAPQIRDYVTITFRLMQQCFFIHILVQVEPVNHLYIELDMTESRVFATLMMAEEVDKER